MDTLEKLQVQLEILEEVAAEMRWPLSEKDQTHSVDNYRAGRWAAYEIVLKRIKALKETIENLDAYRKFLEEELANENFL